MAARRETPRAVLGSCVVARPVESPAVVARVAGALVVLTRAVVDVVEVVVKLAVVVVATVGGWATARLQKKGRERLQLRYVHSPLRWRVNMQARAEP